MKNGPSAVTVSKRKDRGANVTLQKQGFVKGRLCCQFGLERHRDFWTISKARNDRQLDELNNAIHKTKRLELVTRKIVIVHHDNARSRTLLEIR